VDVLGHEDVAEDVEAVTDAEFFEGVFEGEAGVVVIEEWKAVVTTEGDEVLVAEGLVALKTAGHRNYGSAGGGGTPPMPTVKLSS
jgi:hypothetical protein